MLCGVDVLPEIMKLKTQIVVSCSNLTALGLANALNWDGHRSRNGDETVAAIVKGLPQLRALHLGEDCAENATDAGSCLAEQRNKDRFHVCWLVMNMSSASSFKVVTLGQWCCRALQAVGTHKAAAPEPGGCLRPVHTRRPERSSRHSDRYCSFHHRMAYEYGCQASNIQRYIALSSCQFVLLCSLVE
jgi:hypothetical protein